MFEEYLKTKNIRSMSNSNSFCETIDQTVTNGIEKKILHLYTSNKPFKGTKIVSV